MLTEKVKFSFTKMGGIGVHGVEIVEWISTTHMVYPDNENKKIYFLSTPHHTSAILEVSRKRSKIKTASWLYLMAWFA